MRHQTWDESQVIDRIQRSWETKGHGPTCEELANQLQIPLKSASHRIRALKKKGVVIGGKRWHSLRLNDDTELEFLGRNK